MQQKNGFGNEGKTQTGFPHKDYHLRETEVSVVYYQNEIATSFCFRTVFASF